MLCDRFAPWIQGNPKPSTQFTHVCRNGRPKRARPEFPGAENGRTCDPVAVFVSTHITGKNHRQESPARIFSNIKKAFKNHLDASANLMTDEHKKFRKIGQKYANHGRKEYARGNVNTNTIEGVFSIFKRGMTGIYQHCPSN